MHSYLTQFFNSEEELIDYHLFGERDFGVRDAFIIGLNGMINEKAMLEGQEGFGHLFSAIGQSVGHWTSNFEKTDPAFKACWTSEEWKKLLSYEQEFIKIYPRLTNWKHQPPKAPKLFENPRYQDLKRITSELFEFLAN